MTLNELKAAILENGTGIYFELNGKKCGIEPEVQDSVFTFTMWYGDSFKDYSDFDELLLDCFLMASRLSIFLTSSNRVSIEFKIES